MPDRRGRFLLYSDTSKHATGSALYQVQDGNPKLIAYASKGMSEAAKNYSITELEMCSFAINIASFAHLLKRVDFDAIVDHLAIMHIMKSMMELATNRIKRLLELLSSYSFNLYYMKGKDMVLSDFVFRQLVDDSDPHEIIPISFNMKETLKQKYYKVEEDKFLVQTRSQTKSSGIKLPAVHRTTKTLVPHERQEKQPSGISRPRIGQGRAGVRRKVRPVSKETPEPVETRPITNPITQAQGDTTMQIQLPHVQVDIRQLIGPRLETRETPPYINPILRPLPRPPDLDDNNRRDSRPNLITDPNIDFEENSPHQEGIISETYQSADKSYIKELHELADLVDISKLVQKSLPKQTDIDKILDIIKRKVLKGTHLPLTIKEIQAGYLTSPYFKDLYRYLAQNKLPSKRSAICKVETLAERFVLLDSLLFKLVTTRDKETALLAIPEIYANKSIMLYHTSLFAGHQGMIKTYLTISDKFFIPGLMHYLRSFLKGCHICQLVRHDKPPTRQLQTRIHLNYRPLSRLSMDCKVMPRSQKEH